MSTKVYVGNLSWNTSDDRLRSVFSQFGEITDSIVMRDRETGRSRGFGFVTFASPEQASRAIADCNEHELDGRRIKVNVANVRGSAPVNPGGQFLMQPQQPQVNYGGYVSGYPPQVPPYGGYPVPSGYNGGYNQGGYAGGFYPGAQGY